MPLTTVTPRGYETITTWDMGRGVGMEWTCIPTGAPASATWPSANRAILMPICIDSYGTVVELWTANGATASGNFDIGLYDSSYARLVSIGATAQSGTGAVQVFDVTDTPVRPGRYFIGISSSAATGTLVRVSPGLGYLRAVGMVQMASAHPLPSTVTPATVTSSYAPLAGLTYRVTI